MMNIFAEGINFVNFKSEEAYNKFRDKICKCNNSEVCYYQYIENYSNIDIINSLVSKIVVIDLFISSSIAISNKVSEAVFNYRHRHEFGHCIVIIGKFLKDDFIENNLPKYVLYTLTSIMNINSDSDMKVVVNFVKHRNFERSKTYLLSDEFDVIKEDSDDTMEKENNSNELSKNKEENVDMLEIALVVIDSPNNLLNVCQVLNNGGYTPITTDIMSNLNEEGKYYINLYWAIFDPIIYTADLENIMRRISRGKFIILVSPVYFMLQPFIDQNIQRMQLFSISRSIVRVQENRFQFMKCKNLRKIEFWYNLDLLSDMIFASESEIQSKPVWTWCGNDKGWVPNPSLNALDDYEYEESKKKWVQNALGYKNTESEENKECKNYSNTPTKFGDIETTIKMDGSFKQVTRSASDCRLFKNKNVVTNKDGYNSISLSACYICPDCGKVYSKDRLITVTIPDNIEPYNFVLNGKNNTVRCHVNVNHRNGFFCDPLIAQAVCNFNNRGYKTFSCCSGHVTNKCGNLVISSTYIVFKNLTNKQKNKLVCAINNTCTSAYFFEYECNIVNDYHYGNNFALLIETSELEHYELGVCYELSHDEFMAKIYGREELVYDEEIGNKLIENNCKILDILSELVPTITNQELEYKRVSRKDRIREMNKSKNNKQ